MALLHVARDDRRLGELEAGLAFFAPSTKVVVLPAWDTVPYDRIGPDADLVAKRIAALAILAASQRKEPTVVLTTVNAVLQRLPPRSFIKQSLKQIAPGQRIDRNELIERLSLAGFQRTGTVMEPGEYAVRGSLIDLFPPGRQTPVRLDFFDDTLESIKSFDPETQRTQKIVQRLMLTPMSELALGEAATSRFRQAYVSLFGPANDGDQLYDAVSAGQRFPGQEHWLPLFHEKLETLFDYLPEAAVSLDHRADEVLHDRQAQVTEHYQARVDALEVATFGAPP
ncbi:MAG: transcription-repair coupling factor, partial [Proteobacteria bacterium]|nr:transcription-repair coupling factor [Pseudomonadota bacterium]